MRRIGEAILQGLSCVSDCYPRCVLLKGGCHIFELVFCLFSLKVWRGMWGRRDRHCIVGASGMMFLTASWEPECKCVTRYCPVDCAKTAIVQQCNNDENDTFTIMAIPFNSIG